MNPQSKELSAAGQFVIGQQSKRDNTHSPSLSDDQDTTQQSVVHTSSPDQPPTKKPSPTNQRLINDLKLVKVDRSNYRHYGHQSLLTSQSLEKIISDGKKKEEEEERNREISAARAFAGSEEVSRSPTGVDASTNLKIAKPVVNISTSRRGSEEDEKDKSNPAGISSINDSPPTSATTSSSSGIHLQLSQILNVDPKQTIPYNTETVNEILKLRTEQEITRQEYIKNELAITTLELLKLAQSLNITPDLIPFLFLANRSVELLRNKVQKLQENPFELIKKIEQEAKAQSKHSKQSSISSLPSFSEIEKSSAPSMPSTHTASADSNSNLISPTRSPNKLPILSHTKNRSETSEKDISPQLPNSKPVLLPLPGSSYQPQAQTQLLPAKYPLYYTPPVGTGADLQSQYLGSPYMQKHQPPQVQTNLQHSLPQTRISYPVQPSQTVQGAPPQQYYVQQPNQGMPYQYYIATTPPQGAQYIMHQVPMGVPYPPPPPNQLTMQAPPIPYPLNNSNIIQPETEKSKIPSGGSILRFDKEESEDQPPTKKSKLIPKSSNINFMISTPENPPAKKYNNPRT